MFRLDPDGRITRFALQTNGTYQTSPGYFETLVKNNDGSFDLTDKYQTDRHYASVPSTPFALGWAGDAAHEHHRPQQQCHQPCL